MHSMLRCKCELVLVLHIIGALPLFAPYFVAKLRDVI